MVLSLCSVGLQGLSSRGTIPVAASSLFTSLSPILSAAIERIRSGQGKLYDVVTALGAMCAGIQVLKAANLGDAALLAEIDVYDKALQEGIAAFLDSKAGIDLTKLGPVEAIA